jgi:hypothetical protein
MVALAGAVLLLSVIASIASIRTLHDFRTAARPNPVAEDALVVAHSLKDTVFTLKALLAELEVSVTQLGRLRQAADGQAQAMGNVREIRSAVAALHSAGPIAGSEAVQADYGGFTPPGSEAPVPPGLLVVRPTPEQQASYDVLDRRLDDPVYLENLTLADLLEDSEFGVLPEALQRLLVDKAVEKFNRGEIDRDAFIGRLPRAD